LEMNDRVKRSLGRAGIMRDVVHACIIRARCEGMSARTLRLIQRVNVELLMRVRLWATMWSRCDDPHGRTFCDGVLSTR